MSSRPKPVKKFQVRFYPPMVARFPNGLRAWNPLGFTVTWHTSGDFCLQIHLLLGTLLIGVLDRDLQP
jgi:hypothetical protein